MKMTDSINRHFQELFQELEDKMYSLNTQLSINYSTIQHILFENTKDPLVILLCPNYEERSIAIAQEINASSDLIVRPLQFLIISLKNKKNNDLILEDLKESNIRSVISLLHIDYENIHWLDYPNDFSPNAFKGLIVDSIRNDETDMYRDLLLDISAMPRSIIFFLCDHIKELLNTEKIGKVDFAYAEPKSYSKIHYAQDIGILKGMFSGGSLKLRNDRTLHAFVFPSRTGHEGKLFCDTLDTFNRRIDYTIYFPIHAEEYDSSLEIMRANQSLLDREAYSCVFYCSLQDAIKELDDSFTKESIFIKNILKQNKDTNSNKKHTYLVAVFGSKIFLPVAYFGLQRLQSLAPKMVDIEICHIKGFQYTSVYSIGIGDITCFELRRD